MPPTGVQTITVFLTVFSGVLVFVLGQVLVRFFVEPIQELRKIIGEITHVLIYYANVYSNPSMIREDLADEARKALRDKASLLRARANTIPFYDFLARRQVVPAREAITKASKALIGMSNNLHGGDPGDNHKYRDEIKQALGLEWAE